MSSINSRFSPCFSLEKRCCYFFHHLILGVFSIALIFGLTCRAFLSTFEMGNQHWGWVHFMYWLTMKPSMYIFTNMFVRSGVSVHLMVAPHKTFKKCSSWKNNVGRITNIDPKIGQLGKEFKN